MDDLLSKLRSQPTQKPKKQVENTKTKDEPTREVDITTSQSDNIQLNRFKLDFDFLKKNRTGEFITVAQVKTSELYKIDDKLWGIIKSIEVFKGSKTLVYKWEICDETGVIYGSSIVGESVCVGNIICINDFSLWKVNGNHINITDRNILQILK